MLAKVNALHVLLVAPSALVALIALTVLLDSK